MAKQKNPKSRNKQRVPRVPRGKQRSTGSRPARKPAAARPWVVAGIPPRPVAERVVQDQLTMPFTAVFEIKARGGVDTVQRFQVDPQNFPFMANMGRMYEMLELKSMRVEMKPVVALSHGGWAGLAFDSAYLPDEPWAASWPEFLASYGGLRGRSKQAVTLPLFLNSGAQMQCALQPLARGGQPTSQAEKWGANVALGFRSITSYYESASAEEVVAALVTVTCIVSFRQRRSAFVAEVRGVPISAAAPALLDACGPASDPVTAVRAFAGSEQ